MPRVNRDLQRRLAARRERERRRPTERRYQFAPSQVEGDDDVEDTGNGTAAATATAAAAPTTTRRSSAAAAVDEDFSEEYAYVSRDLRRMGVVVGSLLLGLIALSFLITR